MKIQTLWVLEVTSYNKCSKYKHKFKPNTDRSTNIGIQMTDCPNLSVSLILELKPLKSGFGNFYSKIESV